MIGRWYIIRCGTFLTLKHFIFCYHHLNDFVFIYFETTISLLFLFEITSIASYTIIKVEHIWIRPNRAVPRGESPPGPRAAATNGNNRAGSSDWFTILQRPYIYFMLACWNICLVYSADISYSSIPCRFQE